MEVRMANIKRLFLVLFLATPLFSCMGDDTRQEIYEPIPLASFAQPTKTKKTIDLFFQKWTQCPNRENQIKFFLRCAKYYAQTNIFLETFSQTINTPGPLGGTLLHWAVYYGEKETVTLLLSIPTIYVRAQDNNGNTPLHVASYQGRFEISQQLLESKSYTQLDFRTKTGYISITAFKPSQNFLLVNAKNNMGAQSIHFAIIFGYPQIVELLITYGATIHEYYKGATPLRLAQTCADKNIKTYWTRRNKNNYTEIVCMLEKAQQNEQIQETSDSQHNTQSVTKKQKAPKSTFWQKVGKLFTSPL